MIDKNQLEIRNNGQSSHPWTREGHEGESVIQLTLGMLPVTKWTLLGDDHCNQSDNEVIELVVEVHTLE